MNDWSYGYVTEVPYTYGYYAELNPVRLILPFLFVSIMPPKVETACELGFGQGLSINIHAAASNVEWWGTDFNPTQVSFAKELADVSGANLHVFDESFEEFCERRDLPEFDFIGLHGVWSWVSPENQKIIINFIRKKLKVGGVVYISYNTLPGWLQMIPLRELLAEYIDNILAKGEKITDRINKAIDFAERFFETQPAYAKANPQVLNRLKKIKNQNRNYLAHEYFNRDWSPIFFHHMAKTLSEAKLNFACSASYIDHIEVVNLTKKQQEFLKKEGSNSIFSQLLRDFICNVQFRKDYWVKGIKRIDPFSRINQLRSLQVIAVAPLDSFEYTVSGLLGEAKLNESIYKPIIEFLSDYKPKTILQIEHVLKKKDISFIQILQAIMILGAKGVINLVQNENTISKVKRRVQRLNHYILQRSRSYGDINFLASPYTGGGIPVGRFEQMFSLGYMQGKRLPEQLADFTWNQLSALNQRIIKDGKPIQSAEENLAELKRMAEDFLNKKHRLLKSLSVL